ncbi:hypothetical protein ACFLYL_02390 [Chloroflexota bacterium]
MEKVYSKFTHSLVAVDAETPNYNGARSNVSISVSPSGGEVGDEIAVTRIVQAILALGERLVEK